MSSKAKKATEYWLANCERELTELEEKRESNAFEVGNKSILREEKYILNHILECFEDEDKS